MKRVNKTKRVLSRAMCRYCQGCHEVWFDEEHDEYICASCLVEEREKIAAQNEPDEDALNERARLRSL